MVLQTHKKLADGIVALAKEVQGDRGLANLIRRKFAIKCTTGYSLNALVDFHTDDPIEMIKRVIIGSEGTFGFVSQATYNTVPEWPHKVSASSAAPAIVCISVSVYDLQHSVWWWQSLKEGDTDLLQTAVAVPMFLLRRICSHEHVVRGRPRPS